MSLRQGIVVATHPEDHSVDLVMVDNGERVIGAQLLTGSGSSRSGTVDLPEVPDKKEKWDITNLTGQDMIAIVGYIGRNPMVLGFRYPQISEMTFKDGKMRLSRHQSDVMSFVDGDGNISLQHPGGAFIQIGESPEKTDLASKNADGNLKVDRNTGKKVFLRVALAGNAVELTMTPDGTCTLKMEQDFDLQAKGNINMKAEGDVAIEAGGEFRVTAAADAKINGANVRFNEG